MPLPSHPGSVLPLILNIKILTRKSMNEILISRSNIFFCTTVFLVGSERLELSTITLRVCSSTCWATNPILLWPHRNSNPGRRFRKPLFYPLNYRAELVAELHFVGRPRLELGLPVYQTGLLNRLEDLPSFPSLHLFARILIRSFIMLAKELASPFRGFYRSHYIYDLSNMSMNFYNNI